MPAIKPSTAVPVLLFLLLTACSERESASTSRTTSSSTTAATVSSDSGIIVEEDPVADGTAATTATSTGPATPGASSVRIESVTGTNPLVVRGVARTFENNVFLRVSAGTDVLIETSTTAVGDMGQFNPWSAELWLTRMPSGSAVTIEAIEHSAKDGSVSSIDTRKVAIPPASMTVALEFPLDDCTRLRPFQRTVPKTVSLARLLAEALVAGPTATDKASGASAPFPPGSAVRSAILRNGTLTVDFNERLRNVGGACAATAIRTSVMGTMKRLPSVKQVVITAAGSESLALQP